MGNLCTMRRERPIQQKFKPVFFRKSFQSKAAPSNASRNEDKYDIDSYTFVLLATDKENVNRHKIIKFNPCNKYEKTIAEHLPYQHDCAMVSLEGKGPQFRQYTTIDYTFYRPMLRTVMFITHCDSIVSLSVSSRLNRSFSWSLPIIS